MNGEIQTASGSVGTKSLSDILTDPSIGFDQVGEVAASDTSGKIVQSSAAAGSSGAWTPAGAGYAVAGTISTAALTSKSDSALLNVLSNLKDLNGNTIDAAALSSLVANQSVTTDSNYTVFGASPASAGDGTSGVSMSIKYVANDSFDSSIHLYSVTFNNYTATDGDVIYRDPTTTPGSIPEGCDKAGKDVYTPDKTPGMSIIAKTGGVDNQISGFTISILDQDGNVSGSQPVQAISAC